MGEYVDFAQVTADALDFAMEANGLEDAGLRARLIDLYNRIQADPDAAETLQSLRAAGRKTAILSNGCTAMLRSGVAASGLELLLDEVISVDGIRVNKPDRRVYELVEDRLGVAPANVLFVSANGWDAHGGAHFGFNVVWLNRLGQPAERLSGTPWRVGKTLSDVTRFLADVG